MSSVALTAIAFRAGVDGPRTLLRDSHNSTLCKRTDNMAVCGEFKSLSDRATVAGDEIDPLTLGEHYSDMLSTVCMFEKGLAERVRSFVATPHHQSPSYLLGRALEERELLDVSLPLTDDDGKWKRFEARVFW